MEARSGNEFSKLMEFIDNCISLSKLRKGKNNQLIIKISSCNDEFANLTLEDNLGGTKSIYGIKQALNYKESNIDYIFNNDMI